MAELPGFLCIGAQKCGTTWLHHMLTQHPELYLPPSKELSFFDVKRNYEMRGVEWYLSNFKDANSSQVIGEVTPGYLWVSREVSRRTCGATKHRFREGAPSRAKRLLGEQLKLLVLLRDPVDRAISAFVHHLRKGRVQLGESILVAGRRHGIIEMGFYASHILAWLEEFDLANLWIGFYDDVLFDASQWLPEIFRFLGVQTDVEIKNSQARYNKHFLYERIDGDVYLLDAPGVCNGTVKLVSEYEIQTLRDLYDEDARELENLLERRVPWK